MSNERVYKMKFSEIYPLYLQKAERKNRTQAELDEIVYWLTGYSNEGFANVLASEIDLEGFFAKAPLINPNADKVKGVICGVRVEEVADPLMRKIRILDKLVDELAKGKSMDKILGKYIDSV